MTECDGSLLHMHVSYQPLELSTAVKMHRVMSHSSLDIWELDTITQKPVFVIVIRHGKTNYKKFQRDTIVY